MVENSGGPGRFRGAPAYRRQYRVRAADGVQMVMRSDRRQFLPYGLNGGCPGTPSWNIVNPGPGQRNRAGHADGGDPTPGRRRLLPYRRWRARGRGDPLERDPADVAADVAEERITRDYAEAVYGVALDAAGAVDPQATAAARAALREARDNGGGAAPAYLQIFQDSLGLPDFRLEDERRMVYADGRAATKGNRSCTGKLLEEFEIPARHGRGFIVKQGQVFRIAQVVGGQVGDCAFYNADDPKEMFHCGQSWAINVTAGTRHQQVVPLFLFQAAARERHDDGAGRHLSQPLGQYGRSLLDPALRNPRQSSARQPPVVPGKPARKPLSPTA